MLRYKKNNSSLSGSKSPERLERERERKKMERNETKATFDVRETICFYFSTVGSPRKNKDVIKAVTAPSPKKLLLVVGKIEEFWRPEPNPIKMFRVKFDSKLELTDQKSSNWSSDRFD